MLTNLEFEQKLAAVRQAANVIEIHLGNFYRNPGRTISEQIAGAIRSHREAIAVLWQPPPKSMSAASSKKIKVDDGASV
jgi:hypothetical protein